MEEKKRPKKSGLWKEKKLLPDCPYASQWYGRLRIRSRDCYQYSTVFNFDSNLSICDTFFRGFLLFRICLLRWLPNTENPTILIWVQFFRAFGHFPSSIWSTVIFFFLCLRGTRILQVSSLPSPLGRRGVFLRRSWPVPRICFPWHSSASLTEKFNAGRESFSQSWRLCLDGHPGPASISSQR